MILVLVDVWCGVGYHVNCGSVAIGDWQVVMADCHGGMSWRVYGLMSRK